jgi:hypothetical protein
MAPLVTLRDRGERYYSKLQELIVPLASLPRMAVSARLEPVDRQREPQTRHVRHLVLMVSGLSGEVPGQQRPAAAGRAMRSAAGSSGAAAGAWCW